MKREALIAEIDDALKYVPDVEQWASVLRNCRAALTADAEMLSKLPAYADTGKRFVPGVDECWTNVYTGMPPVQIVPTYDARRERWTYGGNFINVNVLAYATREAAQTAGREGMKKVKRRTTTDTDTIGYRNARRVDRYLARWQSLCGVPKNKRVVLPWSFHDDLAWCIDRDVYAAIRRAKGAKK